MAIKLTDTDLKELTAQAQPPDELTYQSLGSGVQLNVPKYLGEGCDRIIKLRNGLTISIRHCRLNQAIHLTRRHESSFLLISKFFLSGASRVRTLDVTDIDTDYEEISGHHYLYHLPNHTEVEEWPADQLIHTVAVYVDPDYFNTFDINKTTLSMPLKKLLEGDRIQRFHKPLGQMTPPIKQLLQQILHCPYTGLMQQLYLESKALELFAAQFALWTEASTPKTSIPKTSISLCAHDIEQLYQAKDILIQQAIHPPSLMNLARQVGLNDRKLKQGFRHLFGTTVFGYLRDYRLQQAQALLHNPNLTIANVAAGVGYKSPEAFCHAFHRKFAVSPKAYQLGQRT